MNNFMLMEPTNQTFQDLIGSGVKYTVPRFQRDYAWTREQWEDLWADIETLEDEHYHYMGSRSETTILFSPQFGTLPLGVR